eukprot:4859674-Alexandrium_andersonii.AAC.1
MCAGGSRRRANTRCPMHASSPPIQTNDAPHTCFQALAPEITQTSDVSHTFPDRSFSAKGLP